MSFDVKRWWRSLTRKERITFRLHLAYAVMDGLSQGILALNEFVLLKSMGASTWQVSLLFQLPVFMLPLSIFIIDLLAHVKDKKKLLRRMAWITRAPLMLFALFPADALHHPGRQYFIIAYLLIFQLYYLANPFLLPTLNLFTKANYASHRFGRLFSISLTTTQIVLLLGTLTFGALLKWDPPLYRVLYPVLGMIGLAGMYYVTRIPVRPGATRQAAAEGAISDFRPGQYLRKVYTESLGILRTNGAFLDFQAGMMAYGIGFLMAQPVITVYLGRYFGLNYFELGFYKSVPVLVSIISLPLFGRYMDRRDPRLLSAVAYFFHMLFFVGLLLALAFPAESSIFGRRLVHFIFAAYISLGLFTAGITLVWSIGSSYFAPADQAARYHSIHLSFTGIRGLLAPPLGVILLGIIGYEGAFTACLLMQILAIGLMLRSLKKRPLG